MSEALAEEVETLTFEDDFHELAFNKLAKSIVERNEAVLKLNAASGDRNALTKQVAKESNDPQIVSVREQLAQAEEALDRLVKDKVDDILNSSEEQRAPLEATVKELESKIRPGITYLKKMYGEGSAKALPTMERARVSRTGSGGRRIRGYELAVSVNGEQYGFENFASASKDLGIPTDVLQNKFFEAAGNPDALKDAPDTVDFSVTAQETAEDGSVSELEIHFRATRNEV